jgi:spore coat polysaccharide biosynthesis predicted glycosyltransferase SpsG
MKVKIFTEGGSSIGLGHISRCSSLYDQIASRGIDVEIIIYGDIKDIDFLNGEIVKNNNWLSDDYLNSYIKNTDYCIVDSYLASKDLYQIISNKSKKAIYIDDNARIEYPVGIIVNPSLSVDNINYPRNGGTIFLLGAKYIILRSPFVNAERKTIHKNVKEVFVSMGGSDYRNLTPMILNDICIKHPEIKFNVVVGNAFHNVDLIESIRLNNIELHYNIGAELMKSLMLKSDFAITAAGQTIYELLATQTPFIAIKIIDNQSNNINGLKKISPQLGIIEYNDEYFIEKLDIEFKAMLSHAQRESYLNLCKNKVDGLGSKRIIDILLRE